MPSKDLLRHDLSHIKLVQFDLDGTLIDSLPQLWQAVNIMLNEQGLAHAELQAVQHWVGNGADKLVERALNHALGHAPTSLEHEKARACFDVAYASLSEQPVTLYAGVHQTLRQLKAAGKILALVTNKPYRFVPDILASSGLAEYFSQVLGGDSLAQKKPDPAPLLHVCQTLSIAPSQTLMVGDSENDVLAAQAAGIKVVGLSYGYNYGRNIADSHPDWVLSDFKDLLELLN